MPANKITIGSVEIAEVSDGWIKFPLSNFFPSVPTDAWEPYRHQLSPEGKLYFNLGSYVLRSDGKTILVDTGLGKNVPRKWEASGGALLEDLKDKGVRPDDVDMVVITHLHIDHVCGNIIWGGADWRPAFPRARYWIPKGDWDIYIQRADTRPFFYLRQQVMPLAELGLIELMEGEQAFTSEVIALPTPGHTPDHTSLVVASQGERGIILGDSIHHPAQVHNTEWSPRVDSDAGLARRTRASLMERLEREGSLAIAGHFAPPGYGRIVRSQESLHWKAL